MEEKGNQPPQRFKKKPKQKSSTTQLQEESGAYSGRLQDRQRQEEGAWGGRPQHQQRKAEGERPQDQQPKAQGERLQDQQRQGEGTWGGRPQDRQRQEASARGGRPQHQQRKAEGERPQDQQPKAQGQRPQDQQPIAQSERPQDRQRQEVGAWGGTPQHQQRKAQGQRPQDQQPKAQSERPQDRQRQEVGAWGGRPQHQQRKAEGERPQDQQPKAQGERLHDQQRQGEGARGGRPQDRQRQEEGAWGGRPQHQQRKAEGERPQDQQQKAQGERLHDQQRQEAGAWGGTPQHQQRKAEGERPQDQQPKAQGERLHDQQRQGEGARGGRPQDRQRQEVGAWGGTPQHQQRKAEGERPQYQQPKAQDERPQDQQPKAQGERRQYQQQQASQWPQQQPASQWPQQQQSQADRRSGWKQQGDGQPMRQEQRAAMDKTRGDKQQRDKWDSAKQGKQGFQREQQERYERPQTQQMQAPRNLPQRQLLPEPDPQFQGVSCAGIKRGTLGSRSIVETNYFTMDLSNMPDIAYHYDVSITPDRPKKFMRIVFDQCQRKHFPKVVMAFDGSKSCYTVQRLEKNAYNFKIEVEDKNSRMKEFEIHIKETDTLEVELKSLKSYHKERIFDKPMRALQTLEVVLSYSYHELGLRVGRSFYRKPERLYDLKDGYEMYTGIYQAAILGEEPLLNVDISHKSFPKAQSLIDYLREIGINQLNSPIATYYWNKAKSYLKGLSILYSPPKCFGTAAKSYKVSGIDDSANAVYFTQDDGKKMSVYDYYNMRGYKLMYPKLNCLQIKIGAKYISLPMELCSIPDYQSLMRKDAQVSQLIRYAATSTTERKRKIMELLDVFQSKENPIVKSFGLHLGQNFIKVHMRLLPSPQLRYVGGCERPTAGAWQISGKYTFLETSKLPNGHKWAIIYAERSGIHNVVYKFQNRIYTVAQKLKVNLSEKCEILSFDKNIDTTLQEMQKLQFALVFVILPSFGTTYSKVKQSAELKYGVLTQCIKEKTVDRSLNDMSVCSNLLLKINAKLNGTNHKTENVDQMVRQLMESIQNVMFLGADVTHPSPDQRNIPSVVGVVASHDAYGACYNMQYRLQRPNLETIEDMENITMQHLQVYKKYQNRYPDYIIYYRDGVSDGQFPIIRNKELKDIRVACKKLNCKAKLTCLVVVKRHHTRFFPLTASKDKFNNVEPGTVVDQRIVHPNEVQFFLVSHQAIQGTAKPTRYNVIEDDVKFDVDLLQQLSYNLCHLFPRCNRSVSYPAPAYLAHLVASRGRVYIEGQHRFDNLKTEYEKRRIDHNFMERNPMYFV